MGALKLTACMKVVAKMGEMDQDSLLERLDRYTGDGVPKERAQVMAASDTLAELQDERRQFMDLLRRQHPDLFRVNVEPKNLLAREQSPQENGAYEQDLLGNPVPKAKRGRARTNAGASSPAGDLQPAAEVFGDTTAPEGEYFVRTSVGTEVQRKLGVDRIADQYDAATATQYLYRSAVERFDGIVTDKDGVPLAIIGGFKGTLSQASVYPATLVGEAVRVPGAAKIWFSHNHPSGESYLSNADRMLSANLSDVFRGSGIEPMGLMAVGNGTFSYVDQDNRYDGVLGHIPESKSSITVPAIEREIVDNKRGPITIESSSDSRAAARKLYAKAGEPGLLLMDARHAMTAWVPLPPVTMGRLRGTGGLNAIYRAVSESNAGSAIIVHGGELDRSPDGASGISLSQNIAAALAAIDVRPLDTINARTGESAIESGQNVAKGAVFSLRRSKLGFYSALEAGIEGLPTKQAPAGAWKTAIKGLVNKGTVKQDEVTWSGIEDWLDLQQGKVAKEQVLEYLKQGGVQVEETVLGRDALNREEQTELAKLRRQWNAGSNMPDAQFERMQDLERRVADAEERPAKYGQYTLPGGENYREVLLTLPDRTALEFTPFDEWNKQQEAAGKPTSLAAYKQAKGRFFAEDRRKKEYQSSHWDQPNVLAHIRLNDRTDADGSRVLFVEELQSDWGQEGKKKGFRDALTHKWETVQDGDKWYSVGADGHRTGPFDSQTVADYSTEALNSAYSGREIHGSAIPTAPFVTKTEGWLNLALKRVMIMAAEGGYDKVAFVNGEQSADRYDLSKQIERIDVTPDTARTGELFYNLDFATKDDRDFNRDGLTASELEDHVGKEMAKKIVDAATVPGKRVRFSGLDLKVGGEGMKTFYDTIVPTALKKLLPKVGGGRLAKVEMSYDQNPELQQWVPLDGEGDGSTVPVVEYVQPGFDVTPAMREKVEEGLTLFSTKRSSAAEMFDQEQIESLRVPGYKSREKLIDMSIDDFLLLAKPGQDESKSKGVRKLVQAGKKFDSIPFLMAYSDGSGDLKVEGHEGRHRARELQASGYESMPVLLRTDIRWSEQNDPDRFDFRDSWPDRIIAEDGVASVPMPVAREDAMAPYGGDIKRSPGRNNEITIDLGDDRDKRQKAKAWVAKVNDMFPRNPMNGRQRVMMFGEDDMALFELDDSVTAPGAAEVKWFQAYPLRSGNGTKGMQELQRLAAEDGVPLTLYPWDKGNVSQASLIKFYKKQGFQPIRRGGKDMIWTPEGSDVKLSPQIKSAIGNNGEFNPEDSDIRRSSIRDLLVDSSAAGGPGLEPPGMKFSLRRKPDPEKTVTAYKLFRVNQRAPGQLFPLFVDADTPVQMGVWLDAEEGAPAGDGKVKSKLGPLAYRPGWHAGDLPVATHIGEKSKDSANKPAIRPANQVWAEVEMAADRDWQEEANKRGTNADGKIIAARAHITDQIPEDGYYRYKTNPNMTGNWLIGGSMRVNRILLEDEVERINDAAGVADLPRAEPLDLERLGFKFSPSRAQTETPEFKRWFGDSKVVNSLGKPRVVYHGTAGDVAIFDMGRAGQTYGLKEEQAFFFTGYIPTAESAADDATDLPVYRRKYMNQGFGGGMDRGDSYYGYDDVDDSYDYTADYNGGQNIMPVYLSLQNPLIIDADQGYGAGTQFELRNSELPGELIARAKAEGHDGIIIRGKYRNYESIARINNNDWLSDQEKKKYLDQLAREDARKQRTDHYFIAFRPDQIKSAIGNIGAFGQRPITEEEANRFGMGAMEANYRQYEGDTRFSTRRQTETPEFKRWFGDSKVVDAEGQPLVVYHGSPVVDFNVFDLEKVNANDPDGPYNGFWFSTEEQSALQSGKFPWGRPNAADAQVRSFYLSMQNPATRQQARKVAREIEDDWRELYPSARSLQDAARLELMTRGFDGVVHSKPIQMTDELRRRIDAAADGEQVPVGKGTYSIARDGDAEYSLWSESVGKITSYDSAEDALGAVSEGIFVAFRPEQIKSATGNNGEFDPENPDIRFSPGRTASGATWDSPSAEKFDDMVYKLQDKLVDTKRVVEAIQAAGGAISDDLNTYLQEELYHGRTAKRTEDFVNMELTPLVQQLQRDGLTMEDLEEYLHARHAPEANKVIAARNPGVADLQDGGSGMKTSDALNYMAGLPQDLRQKLDSAAQQVDAIIGKTRDMYVDYELESKDTVDAWGKMFQHYIPLQREDKDGSPGLGQGFSVKGKETKGRTGSTRKVVDILANIALQRERAIVRGEKNRVAQSLVGLASANPNEGFWTVDIVPTERVYNEKTGLVEDRVDPLYKSRENALIAKIKGADGKIKEHAVLFNEEDQRALRMAGALKNLDAAKLEGLMGVSASISRYFAAVNTQYNPVFGVVNLVRDVQGALLNLGTTPISDDRAKVAKYTMSALRGIYGDARAARKGQNPSSQWAALWDEFQEVGGQTGYRELFRTSADRAEAIKKVMNPDAWADSRLGKIFTVNGTLKVPMAAARRVAGWIFDWLSDYNLAMENGVRLAAYKAGLERGLSKEQAASVAKNLTVNFNRKGQISQQAGAMYAFFNASVQGTARIGQTLFDMEPGKPKTLRLSSFGKKVVYGGVMLGSIQSMMLAAAGYNDDDPPDFVRERSLIIPLPGGKYLTIPMPLGFHVIPNIGRHATEFALSGFKDPHERAVKVIAMFADTFNPIGNAGLSMQTLAPTALDPLVALTENKDYTGKPIARESSNKAIPGHALSRDTATSLAKFLSEGINTLSGGNKYVAGVFSPTPDQIDYLIGQVTGGVGRELSKVEQSGLSLARGEALPTYKIPLAGRFFGDTKQQASEGAEFYANAERLNKLETEIKGLQKDGKMAEAAALRKSSSEAYLITQANVAERQIQRLRNQKRELVKAGAPREQVKALEDQITQVMARLNRAVESLREKAEN